MRISTIKFFQACRKGATVLAIMAFAWFGLRPLVAPQSSVLIPLVGALSCFAIAVVCIGVLASAACPTCDRPFVGSTAEDGEPPADLSADTCQYCGFAQTPPA